MKIGDIGNERAQFVDVERMKSSDWDRALARRQALFPHDMPAGPVRAVKRSDPIGYKQHPRSRKKMFDFMIECAPALCGTSQVIVRFHKPEPYHGRELKGQAWKSGKHHFIDINPELELEEMYHSFLHEASHVREHSHVLSEIPEHEVTSMKFSPVGDAQSHPMIEREARSLADRWNAWADEQVGHEPGDSPDTRLLRKLVFLRFWKGDK